MFAKALNMPVVGIIENMSGFLCPHCGKEINLFKTGGGKKAAQELNIPFLGSIPIDEKIVKSGDGGTPFILEHKKSHAGAAFMTIINNIEKATEGQHAK
jgi:ATP-binding protein involved in chromosome partitioning